MDPELERTLLSVLEWQERWRRWEAIPADARQEFVTELARLMVRLAVRGQDDDGADHG
ncbi:MAG: hypothetical protein OXC14_14445 [Rhodospirillaceae bacterium]|nr:hypothetical protein [Rhodospirillaceae bacterium]